MTMPVMAATPASACARAPAKINTRPYVGPLEPPVVLLPLPLLTSNTAASPALHRSNIDCNQKRTKQRARQSLKERNNRKTWTLPALCRGADTTRDPAETIKPATGTSWPSCRLPQQGRGKRCPMPDTPFVKKGEVDQHRKRSRSHRYQCRHIEHSK